MSERAYAEDASRSRAVAWLVGVVPVAVALALAPTADASHGYSFLIGPVVAATVVALALRGKFGLPTREVVRLAVVSALVELLAAVAIVVAALLLFGL